jgi:hypothetical protein
VGVRVVSFLAGREASLFAACLAAMIWAKRGAGKLAREPSMRKEATQPQARLPAALLSFAGFA